MDAFESLVAMLLRHEGYWVTPSFKVKLTKGEKRKIGTATMPRLELDLIAYKGATNELLVVECKSFLDSAGVRYRGFDGSSARDAKRYKLFNSAKIRQIVFHRLQEQLIETGACGLSPTIHLSLAAGKIVSDSDRIAAQAFPEERMEVVRRRLAGETAEIGRERKLRKRRGICRVEAVATEKEGKRLGLIRVRSITTDRSTSIRACPKKRA